MVKIEAGDFTCCFSSCEVHFVTRSILEFGIFWLRLMTVNDETSLPAISHIVFTICHSTQMLVCLQYKFPHK